MNTIIKAIAQSNTEEKKWNFLENKRFIEEANLFSFIQEDVIHIELKTKPRILYEIDNDKHEPFILTGATEAGLTLYYVENQIEGKTVKPEQIKKLDTSQIKLVKHIEKQIFIPMHNIISIYS
jgi:hypothetical protein